MRMAMAAASLDRPLHPMDRVDVDAELMHEMTANPDRCGLRIERQADAAALEILRRADAGTLVDEDVAMPKYT